MNNKKPANPFAALASLADQLPKGEPTPAKSEPIDVPNDPFKGKLVVAQSRKGRGGKTVTTLTGVAGIEADLLQLAKELRSAFGCGSVVEGREIVLQGEQGARLKVWLEARGAKRVVVGS